MGEEGMRRVAIEGGRRAPFYCSEVVFISPEQIQGEYSFLRSQRENATLREEDRQGALELLQIFGSMDVAEFVEHYGV